MPNPLLESSQTSRPSRPRGNPPSRVPTNVTSKARSSPASSAAPGLSAQMESLRIVDKSEPSDTEDDDEEDEEAEADDESQDPEYEKHSKPLKKTRAQKASHPGEDVEGDHTHTKVTRDKARLKAIASCKRVLEALEGGKNFGKKDKKALEVVNRFAKENVTKLVFSDVAVKHLDELQLSEKKIQFDEKALSARADQRKLTDRFEKTEALVDKIVLSNKEVRSVFTSYNYVLESMDNPGPQHNEKKTTRDPKFSPELPFEPVTHNGKEVKYQFSGIVDMVTFMVDPMAGFLEHDLNSLEALARHSQVHSSSVASLEIKSLGKGFSGGHKGESVAQAKNASEKLGNDRQKFIMTDGQLWKFCIYDNKLGVYHLSNTLGLPKHGKKAVLVALDEWIWEDLEKSAESGLWKYV